MDIIEIVAISLVIGAGAFYIGYHIGVKHCTEAIKETFEKLNGGAEKDGDQKSNAGGGNMKKL